METNNKTKTRKHKHPHKVYAEKWGFSTPTIWGYVQNGCNFDLPDEVVKKWLIARSPMFRVRQEIMKQAKRCGTCKEIKPQSSFHKNKRARDGHNRYCKSCLREKYREANKDKIEAKNKKIAENKERRKSKEYIESRRKIRRASDRRRKDKRREYERQRRATDPNYRLECQIRSRTLKALKNNSKSDSTVGLLGCSIPYARKHLESQFTHGMNWDNHGVLGWHIDHIIPCASFDLSDPEQQRQCFHYTNLQPLWAQDNEVKGDTMPDNHQPQLAIPI